ncbi:hypothetical protein, partial [Faecalibaculum rodentium]
KRPIPFVGIRPFLDLRNYKGVTAPFPGYRGCSGMLSVEAETLDRGLLRMEWLELNPPPGQCVLRTTSTFLHPCFSAFIGLMLPISATG